MKKIILSIFLTIPFYLSAQTYEWAFQAGGSSDDLGDGITTDRNGNVFVTGEYTGNINYGSQTKIKDI